MSTIFDIGLNGDKYSLELVGTIVTLFTIKLSCDVYTVLAKLRYSSSDIFS